MLEDTMTVIIYTRGIITIAAAYNVNNAERIKVDFNFILNIFFINFSIGFKITNNIFNSIYISLGTLNYIFIAKVCLNALRVTFGLDQID